MKELKILKQATLLGKELTVYGDFENPLFLARDVAEWIEYNNNGSIGGYYDVAAMLRTVDEDEKIKFFCELPNRIKNPSPCLSATYTGSNRWFLTEDGVYEVLMQSNKPIAKQFKKGVKKILKDIRTKGGYIATSENDTPEMIMAKALRVADVTIKEHEAKIADLNKQKVMLERDNSDKSYRIQRQKPLVTFARSVKEYTGDISIAELAKILCQNGYETGERRLFETLRKDKFLTLDNLPTQRSIERGLMAIVKKNNNSGYGPKICTRTMITGRGQEYFVNRYK